MTIAKMLSEARTNQDLTKTRAAERLGVSWMTYDMWERGVWVPTAERVEDLAGFTGTSRAVVLGVLGILSEDEVRQLTSANPGYINSPALVFAS